MIFLIVDWRKEFWKLKSPGGICGRVLRSAVRKRKMGKEKKSRRVIGPKAQLRCSTVNLSR